MLFDHWEGLQLARGRNAFKISFNTHLCERNSDWLVSANLMHQAVDTGKIWGIVLLKFDASHGTLKGSRRSCESLKAVKLSLISSLIETFLYGISEEPATRGRYGWRPWGVMHSSFYVIWPSSPIMALKTALRIHCYYSNWCRSWPIRNSDPFAEALSSNNHGSALAWHLSTPLHLSRQSHEGCLLAFWGGYVPSYSSIYLKKDPTCVFDAFTLVQE